jgi:hypothetical protein
VGWPMLGRCNRSRESARGKQCHGLVEPESLCAQGLDQVVGQCGAVDLGEATGVLETAAGGGKVIEAAAGLRAPLPAAPAGLPRFYTGWAGGPQERRWGGRGGQEAPSRRLRQVLHQRSECRQGEVEGSSQLLAAVAAPFFPCPMPLHQPRGSLQLGVAFDGQEACAWSQQVEEAVGIFCIRFTGALLPGLAMVPHGLTGPQADPIATPCEAVVECLPVDTRGSHSDQNLLTGVLNELLPEGLFQALASLAGVRQCKFAAADACPGAKTGMVCGFAHLHSDEEEVRLLYVCFTHAGISSILCQPHGTLLLW